MNYAGKFDAKLSADDPGSDSHGHSHAQLHVNTVSAIHAPPDAIIVQDAQLLFNGNYERSGVDLVLSKDDHRLVLHDYFRGEKHAALASPDGAHLTGNIIDALTGYVQYAQADGSPGVSHVIGHVTKLAGSATVVRNGVSIVLNMGDNVEKGDVVQSGSNSTLGVTFIDGTVFGLSSNARMVLNEMVYDPNGSDNSSLISLVAGTISFVAGETAKHGDMKIDTPVATMGIRGTAVLVEIDFDITGQGGVPDAKFQVLVEPDGTTGDYILFDKQTLAPIAEVNQAGQVVSFSNGSLSISNVPLSADEQKLIIDVFNQKFSDNTNTKSFDHFTSIGIPDTLGTSKLPDGSSATALVLIVTNPGGPSSQGSGPTIGVQHIAGAPLVHTVNNAFTELPGKTNDGIDFDTVSGKVSFTDVNAGDTPTVATKFVSFTYQDAQHNDVTLSLSALQQADIHAVEANLTVVQTPGNNNNGSATWTYSLPDNAFDFLAAGETLTLTYDALVDNNYLPNPEIGIQPFTITITGTNDAPLFNSDFTHPDTAPTIAFAAGQSVVGGPLISSDATSGVLSFLDVDLTDTHTVSTALTDAVLRDPAGHVLLSGVGALMASLPSPYNLLNPALTASIGIDSDVNDPNGSGTGVGTINWQLGTLPVYLADFIPLGDTLTVTYTLTLGDLPLGALAGSTAMSTSTETVTVTIVGTDAAAEVWVDTTPIAVGQTALWTDGANWETGRAPKASDDVVIITNQLFSLTQPGVPLTPTFPVTIDAATAAVANSVTMNDFLSTPPELDILASGLNSGSLTLTAGLNLSADSIVKNWGTINVGGQMELLDQLALPVSLNKSVVVNFGTIKLGQGGDFQGLSSITNSGTIEVQGGSLDVLIDIVNSDLSGPGKIVVDAPATLALGTDLNNSLGLGGTAGVTGGITGGTVTVDGTLKLQGGNFLTSGKLTNSSGQVSISGSNNSFSGETVSNTGTASAIDITGALTVQTGTAITNQNAASGETVDSGGSLTLADTSSITGGKLVNLGDVHVELSTGALLDGVDIDNSGGTIHIDTIGSSSPARLIIDNGTSINDGSVHIGSVGTLEVSGGGATLTGGVTVTIDSGGIVQVDDGITLTLSGATVDRGTVNDGSTLGSGGKIAVTGSSEIENASLNYGKVTIASGQTLNLDDDTITGTTLTGLGVTSTIKVDGGDTLVLDGVTINGSSSVTIGALGLVQTNGSGVTWSGTDVTNDGIIEVQSGGLKISGSIGGSGSVQIDAGTLFELNASDTQNISYAGGAGAAGELQIDTSSFAGTITGLSSTDELDLRTIGYGMNGLNTTGTYVSNSAHTGGVLTITDGANLISMTLAGDYRDAHFAGATDGHGGTLITLNAVDDAPAFTSGEKLQTGTVTELLNTTGASTPDASTPTSGTIHFTDIDLTDRPTATITAQTLTWTAADGTHPTVPPTQLTAIEKALQLQQPGNTNNGAIGWTYSVADSALDFLAAGETLQLVSTVTLNDQEGGTDTATVTINITSTNDTPTISATSNAFSEASNPTQPNPTGSTAADTTSGTISFADVDLSDHHTVSITGVVASGTTTGLTANSGTQQGWVSLGTLHDSTGGVTGSDAWTFSAPDDTFDYLAAGEQLILTYTAQVSDGNGGIITTPFTVTVTGTNDAPTIATGSVLSGTVGVPIVTTGTNTLSQSAAAKFNAPGLISGLPGETGFGTLALPTGDDNSSGRINITSVFGSAGLDFFGTNYTSLFINNNGNVTFGATNSTYTPTTISSNTNNPMIAPFWADVDTRGHGAVYYDLDAADGVMTVTWDAVGYYDDRSNKLDTFQLVLINEGNGNFNIEYRYGNIQWTAGDASGGSSGLGGTAAHAGYSAGDGVHSFQSPESGNQAELLELPTALGNTGIAGVDAFAVRNGTVAPTSLTATGKIDFSDPDLSDTHTASSTYTGGGTELGTLSLTKAADTTGTGTGGEFDWTYTVDFKTARTALDSTIAHTKVETFNVVISDGHGGTLSQTVSLTLAETNTDPAGVAGSAINLGLAQVAGAGEAVTITGMPANWTMDGATHNADGSWTAQTNDFSTLTITPDINFVGASALNVIESWTNPDGSASSILVSDNVEAYAPGSPIFAVAGDDHLTGSGSGDLFVFAQPIGNDVINNYNAASDKIDLVGFDNIASFSDLQGNIVDDANGNAVVTIGINETITVNGVHAASLTANDFVFDQTPVTANPGTMQIGDGAHLSLSGDINNTGIIELNSSGDETDLQLIEHGATFSGGGQVVLSDSAENSIVATNADVTLTNVDNNISGAGQIGAGQLTLINEGTINATGANSLVIDTGANAITNSGTLEATGNGGLVVDSDIVNTGVLWANGGNVTIEGNVSGNGSALISGSSTFEFAAASTENVTFASGSTGVLVLDHAFDFSGVVSGMTTSNQLDLLDFSFAKGTTLNYTANAAGNGGTLNVTDGEHTANIALSGHFDPAGFQAGVDHGTGTLISYHDAFHLA